MLMQIDGTFIAVVISFLIFLFIIKAILFNPITKVITERENFYDKNSKMEKESKEKSKNLLLEKEESLKQSRIEAGKIIKDTTKEAKEESDKKIEEAKKEVLFEKEKKIKELQTEANLIKNDLKKEVSGFVSSIVSKVLNENVDINIDDEKLNKYLKI